MATVPSPRTWTAGEKLQASVLNTQLRDALNFLLNPPSCRVYNNADATIATGATAWSTLAFNSESWDTDGMHSTVTNNSRITIVTAGKYRVFGAIQWAANATGIRRARIMLNGATVLTSDTREAASAQVSNNIAETQVVLAVNDYIEMQGAQSSGGNLAATGADNTTWLLAQWIGTS